MSFEVRQRRVAIELTEDRVGEHGGEYADPRCRQATGAPEASDAPRPGQARTGSHDREEAQEQDDHP